jgi:hypothetical protein
MTLEFAQDLELGKDDGLLHRGRRRQSFMKSLHRLLQVVLVPVRPRSTP